MDKFIKTVLIVCPTCGKQALVVSAGSALNPSEEQHTRATCTNCGFSKRLDEKPDIVFNLSSSKAMLGKYMVLGAAIDPYFHLPLWLTTNCCNNMLWAYNYDHLNFLKDHIQATLRERNAQEPSNQSLGSRLPAWMTSAKNREAVLKGIAHLQQKAL